MKNKLKQVQGRKKSDLVNRINPSWKDLYNEIASPAKLTTNEQEPDCNYTKHNKL